jgi:hypothetical protein
VARTTDWIVLHPPAAPRGPVLAGGGDPTPLTTALQRQAGGQPGGGAFGPDAGAPPAGPVLTPAVVAKPAAPSDPPM